MATMTAPTPRIALSPFHETLGCDAHDASQAAVEDAHGLAECVRRVSDNWSVVKGAFSQAAQPASPGAEVVERVARAICRAWYYCDLDKPDGLAHWRDNKDRCMAEAKAALAAAVTPPASPAADCLCCHEPNDCKWGGLGPCEAYAKCAGHLTVSPGAALDVLRAIIWASDQCLGHAACGHSMQPWKDARRLLDAPTTVSPGAVEAMVTAMQAVWFGAQREDVWQEMARAALVALQPPRAKTVI